jgi:hypothetical protein
MIQIETHLRCDFQALGCIQTFGVDDMCQGYGKRELRQQAKRNYWVFVNGMDVCPNCQDQLHPSKQHPKLGEYKCSSD